MTIRALRLLAAALVVATSASAFAFGGPGGPPDELGPRPGHFLRLLYPPRVVMKHATDIDLTTNQRNVISEQVRDTQKDLVDVEWKLGEATNELEKLLEAEKIDERAAIAQAKVVMGIEEELKQRHLRLLIRIRNLLTPEQRAKLQTLRANRLGFAPRIGTPPEAENE